jgi:hypothetical protein
VRLRIGIVLWLMSWVPFAAIVGADSAERAAIWTAQVVIGILGLALAGTAFATMVKTVGWRHAPAAAWRTLLHGQTAIVAAAPPEPTASPTAGGSQRWSAHEPGQAQWSPRG